MSGCYTSLGLVGYSKNSGNLPVSITVSLYNNFDHLLWRATELGANDETLAKFPWILWYLWKARNEKVFKNEDTNPLETLQFSIAEEEAWSAAQRVEQTGGEDSPSQNIITGEDDAILLPRCQVDASWGVDSKFSGGGFVLDKEDGEKTYGAISTYHAQSPLHKTDCLQIVKIFDELEVWPSLTTELEEFYFTVSRFNHFSLVFIPHLLNLRADC
ncbi:unnamed protein product [Microthlaspi erraticum]|uniref:RNase H type-1 domain-containing protein n=1 Tax=Microthlaspi erraticum TaxID=1685480 RepID=A0A6D2HSN8_9BRAS|nr:unnamed protein product [Microthlaspi erraticum]